MDVEFEKLIALQELDNELRSLFHLLEITPHKLEEIDHKIAAANEITQKAKEKLWQNQKKRRELEGEVKELRNKLATFKRQLNDVKTNKEYTALLKEIEDTQHKIDAMEEEIIGAMLEADDIEKEIESANLFYSQEEARFKKEKEAILQKKSEYEARVQLLQNEKQKLCSSVSREQIALYQRIAEKKGGVAISPVTDDFCSMCHMRIRPQVLNELYDMKKIYLCENCGRILYLPLKDQEKEEEEKEAGKKAAVATRPSSK